VVEWLLTHWPLISGVLTSVLLGTWRFGPRVKGFLAGRFALEKENFYLKRERRITEAYIDMMEKRLNAAGIDVSEIDSSDGLE
jgi:hypothetical protein